MRRLVAVGLSHRSADLGLRGRVAVAGPEARCLLANLRSAGADEAALVQTCNRTELYLAGDDAARLEAAALVELAEVAGGEPAELAPALFHLRDDVAVLHLNRVAAGLESLVPGEGQILAQVRDALAFAEDAGTVGPLLARAFQRALQTGKRVRSETGIAQQNASVASVAARLADDELGGLASRSALVVGAGRTSELTALNLIGRGLRSLTVASRTYATACSLAERLGAGAIRFDAVPAGIAAADLVVSSTSAPHPVIEAGVVREALRGRADRSLLVIDLAVPRDVEVGVGDVDGCALLDLDDLHAVISRNVALRRREARAAEHMCAEAAAEYRAWSAARAVVPTVEDIRERGERIRRAEVERAAARWPDISDDERERIERLSRSIVGKLLHGPTVQLRADAAEPDALGRAETARRLFGLDEPDA